MQCELREHLTKSQHFVLKKQNPTCNEAVKALLFFVTHFLHATPL